MNTVTNKPTAFSVRDAEAIQSRSPKIVEAGTLDIPRQDRPSVYSQYDKLMVGQAIISVPGNIVNTIVTRLKRRGMHLQVKKMDDNLYAIIRIE